MDYKIYQSDLIEKNYKDYVNQCNIAFNDLSKFIKSEDTTWKYNKYNLFSITTSSLLFYNLYKELNYYIRDYVGDDRPLWMECWLNYHKNDKILSNSLGTNHGFHGHTSEFHGYISIDPQNTITKFRNGLEIKNKIGQIYIGPGNKNVGKGIRGVKNDWDHMVEVILPSLKPRITIGFNLQSIPNFIYTNKFLIPLL